ncbi:MAG: hypothetical protein ACSLFM_09725 [Tepidiformaceae bacterium]
MPDAPARCIRCLNAFTGPGYLMAGRRFCCNSCSVGSACEHQHIHRAANVRRYDSTFRPFRAVVRHATPYERDLPSQ